MNTRRRTLLGVVALLAVDPAGGLSTSSASAPVHAQAPDQESEIARLMTRWADARVRGDAEFLERFYAAELRIGGADGRVIERADDIRMFATGQIKPEFIRNTEVVVRVHGHTAIVTCIESLRGTYRGAPGEMSLRMLNVLVHRDGRWQLAATQSARIAGA